MVTIRSERDIFEEILRRLESPNRKERKGVFRVEIASGGLDEMLKNLRGFTSNYRKLADQVRLFGAEPLPIHSVNSVEERGTKIMVELEVELGHVNIEKLRKRLRELAKY